MEEENIPDSTEEKKTEPVVSEPEPTSEPVTSEPVTSEPEPKPETRQTTFSEPEVKQRPVIENKLVKQFSGKIPSFKLKFNWNIRSWPNKIMHTLREYKRVIIVSKKPDIEELSEISKIAGIGLILVGLIGFILQTMFQFFV